MFKKILLSIKPNYMIEILNGNKVIELRKRIGRGFLPETKIYLYASSPVKALVGTANLKKIEKLTLQKARHEQFDIFNKACIGREDFDEYFKCSEFCYFLHVDHVKTSEFPVSLLSLGELGVTPPQSFCYLTQEHIKKIDSLLEGA